MIDHTCTKCGKQLNPVNWWTAGVYDRFGGEKYKLCDECAEQARSALRVMFDGGGVTAEQVKQIHDVIEKHWHDLPAEYDMPEATALPEYSYDWQAIADELNAMLGSDAE